jgi:hypothetical protein
MISTIVFRVGIMSTIKRFASDATFQSNLLFNALYQDGAEEIISLDVLCHDVVEDYQKEKSILLEPNSNKSMFIACTWTSKEERQLFQLNPFVMKIDATCHTNNKKRHLLTFTSKNISAKAYIFKKNIYRIKEHQPFVGFFRSLFRNYLERKPLNVYSI